MKTIISEPICGPVDESNGEFCCWRGSMQGQLGSGRAPPVRQTSGCDGHVGIGSGRVVPAVVVVVSPVVDVVLLVVLLLVVIRGGVTGVWGFGGVGWNVGITAGVDGRAGWGGISGPIG